MNERQKEQLKERWELFENAFYELYGFAKAINPKLAPRIESIIDDDSFYDFKGELRDLGVLEAEDYD